MGLFFIDPERTVETDLNELHINHRQVYHLGIIPTRRVRLKTFGEYRGKGFTRKTICWNILKFRYEQKVGLLK